MTDVVVETSLSFTLNPVNDFIMKNCKKISRDQLKSINGGASGCSEACCPPPGIKRCPWVICIAPCDILS